MKSGCTECERLWDEYKRATIHHIRLDSQLRIAALMVDQWQIEALTPDLESAKAARDWRNAIRVHDAKAHTTDKASSKA